MLSEDLRSVIDGLWDKFWAGGLANPLSAIDQINLLIFLKRLEDIDNSRARRAAATGNNHISLFEGTFALPDGQIQDEEVCRWSHWSLLPAEEMFVHVQTVVFPWVKQLAPGNHAFTKYLADLSFLIPKPSLLVEATKVIETLNITDRNVDTQGDIYEYMLSKLSLAGQIGQFRTPRHIIRAMVAMLNPRIGETVMDPACGTGGFLVATYQHLVAMGTSEEFLDLDKEGVPHGVVGDQLSQAEWDWLGEGRLIGYDFDPTVVRIAAMNMVLHGIENPQINYADALGGHFSHTPRAQVVLANPPFAGSVAIEDLSDDFNIRTKKTELLFVDLIESLLTPGGRAGVIVPDGVLFGSTKAHLVLRKRLVDMNRVDAVISLPAGVFKPYSGVSASILIFTRGGSTDEVWMYDLTADGYSLDDKREPIETNDIPDLLAKWPSRVDGPNCLQVDRDQIVQANYDLSVGRYKPLDFKIGQMKEPLDLLAEVTDTISQVEIRLASLKELLR